jgi:hypothetical protein
MKANLAFRFACHQVEKGFVLREVLLLTGELNAMAFRHLM